MLMLNDATMKALLSKLIPLFTQYTGNHHRHIYTTAIKKARAKWFFPDMSA